MLSETPFIQSLQEADFGGSWPKLAERFESLVVEVGFLEDLFSKMYDIAKVGQYPTVSKPYQHVNGFVKFILYPFPITTARLALHYWPATSLTSRLVDEGRPHNHRFSFSSILLGGKQEVAEYDFHADDEGRQFTEFEYRPQLSGRLAWVKRCRMVKLKTTAIAQRRSLVGIYRVNETTVHTTTTDASQSCATLVLRGPRVRRTATVYYEGCIKRKPWLSAQFGRLVGAQDIQDQVRQVLKML